MLKNTRMESKYLSDKMINKLISSLIRPRLEYEAVIWSPHKKKDIKEIEIIQNAAAKVAPSLKDLPYELRISRLKLPTLG